MFRYLDFALRATLDMTYLGFHVSLDMQYLQCCVSFNMSSVSFIFRPI